MSGLPQTQGRRLCCQASERDLVSFALIAYGALAALSPQANNVAPVYCQVNAVVMEGNREGIMAQIRPFF